MFRFSRPQNLVTTLLLLTVATAAVPLSLLGQEMPITQVTIDGNVSDWGDAALVVPDSRYDEAAGFLGFAEGRAFLNQNALYFAVEIEDPDRPFAQFDIFVMVGVREYLISWSPGSPEGYRAEVTSGFQDIGPTEHSLFACDAWFEVRLDLRDLMTDEPHHVGDVYVVAMYGECCEDAWRPSDEIGFPPELPVLAEVDAPRLLGNLPGYALAQEFRLPDGYLAGNVYDPPLKAPSHVAVGPDGTIVITDWGSGDTLFELATSGELGAYCPAPSDDNSGIAFDADGNLLVTGEAGILWKIDPQGNASEFAHGFHCYQLDVGPAGEVYGTEGSGTCIQRVSTNGEVTQFATGFTEAIEIAVSPTTGDVFVYDKGPGIIYRVTPDGTKSELARGVLREWNYIACSADGRLYMTDLMDGLCEVSTRTGRVTAVPWVWESLTNLHPCDFAFDPQGRIVCVDITMNHVVRFDLTRQRVELLWQGMGNTRALATDPAGTVYMGVSHPSATGEGYIVRLGEGSATEVFATGLLSEVEGLAFGPDGTGYAIARGSASGRFVSRVYEISATGGVRNLVDLPEAGWDLAVDPTTGTVWGIAPRELWWIDSRGRRRTLSTRSAGEMVESLAFTPDGTLYIVAYPSADLTTIPVASALYRVDVATGRFDEVADLSTVGICCPMGRIGAGADGCVYWVGHGDLYLPGHNEDMHMLRIAPDGTVTVFATNLPMDPSAVTGSLAGPDLYFASGSGVFRIYPEE